MNVCTPLLPNLTHLRIANKEPYDSRSDDFTIWLLRMLTSQLVCLQLKFVDVWPFHCTLWKNLKGLEIANPTRMHSIRYKFKSDEEQASSPTLPLEHLSIARTVMFYEPISLLEVISLVDKFSASLLIFCFDFA